MAERKSIYDQRVTEEEAQLVNTLEGFRTECISRPGFNADVISQMSAIEEIVHYLNGFDFRMYEWMATFHRNSDGAVTQQIEEFTTKLAQHRATYPRPPAHRRLQQEEAPKFDAFIRMRDNIRKILQDRIMWNDHVMFNFPYSSDPRFRYLSTEHRAMNELMMILETIGIEINYPEVQTLQNVACLFGFSEEWKGDQRKVRKLLRGKTDIMQWQYEYMCGTKDLYQKLSRVLCIGRSAADDIVKNVQTFILIWVKGREEDENNLEASASCRSACSVQ